MQGAQLLPELRKKDSEGGEAMSKLTVDECKRIIMQGKKQLTAAEQRIAELEANNSSRWFELFGTPERAARVIAALNNCRVTDCIDCWARGACRYYGCGDDYDALLGWLRGDA